MKILSDYDSEFKSYGKVLSGYDTAELLEAMKKIPLPETGTAYEPSIDCLEACKNAELVRMEGEGHGFTPDGAAKAMKIVLKFLDEHCA